VNLGCQQQERQQKKYIFAETGERTEVVAGVLHAWSASPVPLILPLPLPRPFPDPQPPYPYRQQAVRFVCLLSAAHLIAAESVKLH